ncbi:MAG: hydroxyacylglutathione hydrolase [Cellvibrionaceae bacterium]
MLNVIAVPAFQDNYLWLLHAEGCRDCYVVDPGDAKVIEAALESHNLELAGVLLTHHHWDHTGGVEALTEVRSIPVYGPNSPNIPQVTHALAEGDQVSLSGGLNFTVLEVPGHTLDHIAYFNPENPALFCGDALFAGGCGRMFEGTAPQMQASLAKMADLPSKTQIYCAHEYTQANLRFALAVEPENQFLVQRAAQTDRARSAGQSTVPSELGVELQTNPFLRWAAADVIAAASTQANRSLSNPEDVFGALRSWKDNF